MTPMFDQSAFLAARKRWAEEMGPPKLPAVVALPGAKAPIATDRLKALQELGLAEHEIIKRINGAHARNS